MNKQHVVVLGGGVAGLSAAHELAERGYRVSVYEQKPSFGGKARSMPVPNTAQPGRHRLPGEHGFRFVPGFYKHLPDTMSRIPYARQGGGTSSVLNNLVKAALFAYARDSGPDVEFPTHLPQTVAQFIKLLWMLGRDDVGLTVSDIALFSRKLLVLLSSCDDRRLGQWETIAWWDFIEAAQRSPVYQKYLARGISRSLVAMKAEVGSTRTVGYILLQLMLSMVKIDGNLDRLLNGPTDDVWIHPWISYLRGLGVDLHHSTELTGFRLIDGRVAAVQMSQNGKPFEVAGDYYIAAVPVEKMTDLLTPELLAAAPSLAGIKELRTDWMNGIQLYLDRDVPEVHGHVVYIDSPWSLTSVSQRQFWKNVDFQQYADGKVKGLISIDISDWETPGVLYGKAARDCTRQEIEDEVVAQMKHHINGTGPDSFAEAKILYWHLDPDIVTDPPGATRNLEPLLINTKNSWSQRPEATCEIDNLLLASDYVRTFTDLATMEGANEAARRAVNAILNASQSAKPRCGIWPLEEPWVFAPLRAVDQVCWMFGLRNLFDWNHEAAPLPTKLSIPNLRVAQRAAK